ncbi:MAG: hypothetical protein ABI461_02650 [Polyangiaceae bacterium]
MPTPPVFQPAIHPTFEPRIEARSDPAFESAPPTSERPPMSMSVLPPSESYPPPPSSQPTDIVKPPVLASDILRDDVAPIAPAQRAIVLWLILLSLSFGSAAFLSWMGFLPRSMLIGSAATAAVAALAALLPVPYTARALLAAAAGLIPLVLGAQGSGPLAAMHLRGDILDFAPPIALTVLPGALLFRARYRAFTIARVLLGCALLLSLPAAFTLATTALDEAAPLVTRIADGVVLVAILGSCFGFMGAETTGFGAFFGATIVTVHAAGIGLRGIVDLGQKALILPVKLPFLTAGLGEWLAATLAAHAIFQLLASLLAKRARRVDVHRIVGPSAERESDPGRLGEDDRAESLGHDD